LANVKLEEVKNLFEAEKKKLGPLKRQEKQVMAVFSLAVTL
jgi:hypothetical protein